MKSKKLFVIAIIGVITIISIVSIFLVTASNNKTNKGKDEMIENKTTEIIDKTNNSEPVNILSHINSFNDKSKYSANVQINEYEIEKYPIDLLKDSEITKFNVWANGDRKDYKREEINILSMQIDSLTSAVVTAYRKDNYLNQVIVTFYNRYEETKTIEELAKEGLWSASIETLNEYKLYGIDKRVESKNSIFYSDLVNCLGDVSYIVTYEENSNSLEDLIKENADSYLIWDYDSVLVMIECGGTKWGYEHKLIGKSEFNAKLSNVDKKTQKLRKIDKISN